MWRILRLIAGTLGVLALVVFVYLAASVAGAIYPGHADSGRAPGNTERIYLLTTLLHADFAIPVDDAVRKRFAHLAADGIPIFNPNLKFLVFGWGSHAFYTTARNLTDIRPGPTFTAVTGDNSVVRMVPAGDITELENAYAVDLPAGGTERLLDFIENSIAGFRDNHEILPGKGLGTGDVFFVANGGFHIFRPCNIWAADGLRVAGLNTGKWTPTTHSLLLGLRLHSPQALQD
ncbi:MAG: TIGR02117 family protein [Pseudomonadota bacterium]